MLDCHCHIDRYENPYALASDASKWKVFVVAVTNLPSHFQVGHPHVRSLSNLRLALGLHPLLAAEHQKERELFRQMFSHSSFIGEVGLDFSAAGMRTKDIQVATFRFVAQLLASSRKVVSIHSRGAEASVFKILNEFAIPPVIFHWYSGPLGLIDELARAGHFFSINTAMIASKKGMQIIERIPIDRILTESDGPYIKKGIEPVKPWDVKGVEEYLSALWQISPAVVSNRIWRNFEMLLGQLGLVDAR